MRKKVMIVSDAWHPQTNGVVRCFDSVQRVLLNSGYQVDMLTPDLYWTVPMPSYPEIRLALAGPVSISQHILQTAPDFIHIATEGPLGLQARLFCDWNHIPFTTSYHTRFPEYLAARAPVPPQLSYAYLRWFHWEAQSTLVPTASVARELTAQGFRRIQTWTRGVDRSAFHTGAKTMFADLKGPHLLYVGRVAVEKNIEAFLQLETPGTKIIVGDGPGLTEMKSKYPRAQFLGKLHGNELRAAYQSADVFVFPSKTDTFGNVMLEAMACGTPVAAYPVSGPIDVITDPKAGCLHNDLGCALEGALKLKREDALAHSQLFSWEECTRIFAAQLAPTGFDQKVAA